MFFWYLPEIIYIYTNKNFIVYEKKLNIYGYIKTKNYISEKYYLTYKINRFTLTYNKMPTHEIKNWTVSFISNNENYKHYTFHKSFYKFSNAINFINDKILKDKKRKIEIKKSEINKDFI